MVIPLDTEIAERCFTTSTDERSADQSYDEEWALTLLRLTLERLRAESAAAGKPAEFEALNPVLMCPRK